MPACSCVAMANWIAGSIPRFISASLILPSRRRFTRSTIHRGRGSEPMPMVGKSHFVFMPADHNAHYPGPPDPAARKKAELTVSRAQIAADGGDHVGSVG